jgi:hypothetical protein
MEKSNWIWMPHAGHLCVGAQCQFHLNTYVGKYIVSTVGEYWPDREVREIHASVYDNEWFRKNVSLKGDFFDSAYMKKFGFEDLGFGRKYETMVFKAHKGKLKYCPYEQNSGEEVDMEGYNDAGDAYEGHKKMCNKWSK